MIGLLDCPTPPLVRGKIRQVRFDNKGRSVITYQAGKNGKTGNYFRVSRDLMQRVRKIEAAPVCDLFFLPLIEE